MYESRRGHFLQEVFFFPFFLSILICILTLFCRCRAFPALINCCTIDWFDEWSEEALSTVAKNLLKSSISSGTFFSSFLYFCLFIIFLNTQIHTDENAGSNAQLKSKVVEMCVGIHVSVKKVSEDFNQEHLRRYYTTPTLYLELVNLCILFLLIFFFRHLFFSSFL